MENTELPPLEAAAFLIRDDDTMEWLPSTSITESTRLTSEEIIKKEVDEIFSGSDESVLNLRDTQ